VFLGAVGRAGEGSGDLEERISAGHPLASQVRADGVADQGGRGAPFGPGRYPQATVEVFVEVDLRPLHVARTVRHSSILHITGSGP